MLTPARPGLLLITVHPDQIPAAALTVEVTQIEAHAEVSSCVSRARIRTAITQRHTLPATSPLTGAAEGAPTN